MSEEKIQDLVSENLKVRVVLNEAGSKDGQLGAAGSTGDRPGIDDRLEGARSAAAARRVEAVRQDALKVERKEYTYHYGRIFAAVMAVLGLLGVLVYVAYTSIQGVEKAQPHAVTGSEKSSESAIGVEVGAVMSQLLEENRVADDPELIVEAGVGASSDEAISATAISGTEAAGSAQSAVVVVEQVADSAATEKAAVVTAMADTQSAIKQEKVEVATEVRPKEASKVEQQVDSEALKPVTALPKKPANVVVKLEQAASSIVSKPSAAERVQETASNAVNKADDVVDVVQVQVFSDDVTEVQMSGQIGARRPVGELPVEVKLGEPAFQTVYIFTTLNNRVGDRVIYQWKRNGRLQAEVPVRVRGQKWQTYSSKNINGQMVGDWSIELVDQKGNVLLRGEFRAVH